VKVLMERPLLCINPNLLLLVVVHLVRCCCWVQERHHECDAVGCKAGVHT
jgi:hypothetical protein